MANHSVRYLTYPLLQEGKSVSEVAQLTGCKNGTIIRHARELKIIAEESLTPRYEWSEVQKSYDAGTTPTKCMEKFGFSSTAWARAINTGKIIPDPARQRKRGPLCDKMEGIRFGRLVVLKKSEFQKPGGIRWDCQCDCGNIVPVTTANLNHGENRSCGCSRFRKGSKSAQWKGYGEIGAGYWGEVKRNAHSRDLAFEITIEQAWDLFLQQNECCALSGVKITLIGSEGGRTASLDRIDSDKSYTLDNVQWVHKDLNYMKSDFSQESFFFWIDTIYQHQHSLKQDV